MVENDATFTTSLLVDSLNDMRTERKFMKKLCLVLCVIIVGLICGIIGTNIYYQEKMFRFLNETEFTSEIDVNNDSSINYGSISVK